MDALFYWHAIRRYWWLVLLPVVVTVAMVVTLERLRGPQYQATLFFLVSSPYDLTYRDYTRTLGSTSAAGDDQIPSPFDFANIANSFQVAARTIDELDLSVKSALDLFKPDMFELRPPTVQITPGSPQGDAASKGLLTELLGISSSSKEKVVATSRWVELTALTYSDPALADRLARTHARNALDYYREIQARNATLAEQQIASHLQDAREQLTAAEQARTRFESAHQLLTGGAEFQSAQALLDDLRKQRTDLVSAAGGQAATAQRREELAQEVADLEALLEEAATQAGNAHARMVGQRSAAEGRVAAAQAGYSQALQSYVSAQREVSLARVQGFPASRSLVQTVLTGTAQSTVQATETQSGYVATSTTTQPGYTQNAVQNTPEHTSSSTTSGSTTRPGSSTSGTACDSTNACSTTDSTTSDATETSQSTVETTTPATSTTITTTIPSTTSSTSSATPPRVSTTTTTTTTRPTASTQTTEEPLPLQSEEQATAYLEELGESVDYQANELARAEGALSQINTSDPTPVLEQQAQSLRDKLGSARSAYEALLRADTDPAAGLQALDNAVRRQEQRIAYLGQIGPDYRRLQDAVEQSKEEVDEQVRLLRRYTRLRADALAGAGVRIVGEPYTQRLSSKVQVVLAFGVMISLLFGTSLAFGLAYVDHLRRLGSRPSGPGGPDGHSGLNPEELLARPTPPMPVLNQDGLAHPEPARGQRGADGSGEVVPLDAARARAGKRRARRS